MPISPPHTTGPPPPNDDRATPGLLIATWVFFVVALTVVFVRIYTRFCVKNATRGWDDVCMVVATLLGFVWAIITSVQVHLGYGKHAFYIPKQNAHTLGSLNIVVTDINALVLFFVRTSICIFLFRMTKGTANSIQWTISISGALILNALVAIATIILYSILCIPLRSLWDLGVPGNCTVLEHATNIIKVLGAINCLVDFLCVIIPTIIICSLQLKSRTQLGLVLILLSCGVVTAACSVGRVVSLRDQVESDPTYDWVDQTYWQIAEQYGGIIFASLPAIRQLSTHWKQTRSLRASKPSKLYLSKNSTHKASEPQDDYGNPRTPGRFSPGPNKFVEEYVELEGEEPQDQYYRGRMSGLTELNSPRDKSLPPLPEERLKSGWEGSP